MKSFTEQRNIYGDLTLNSTAANLTLGDTLMNNFTRTRIGGFDYPFLERTRTGTTVAAQQTYALPADVKKIRTITFTVGSTVYEIDEAPSRQFWDTLNLVSIQNTYPDYYYIIGNSVSFYPIPSTSSITITYDYKKKFVDLSTADYTTGTLAITTATTAVVGTGTTFTAAMVGRYLKTSDNFWYEITAFTNGTTITIGTPYLGATITAGTYIIGDMSILPDGFENLPVYDAVAEYFYTQKKDFGTGDRYKKMADELENRMKTEEYNKTTNVGITNVEGTLQNPNLVVSL